MTLRITPAKLVERAEESGRPGLLGIDPDWSRVRLGEIAQIVNGAPFKSGLFNAVGRGMPLIRIRDVGASSIQTWYDGPWDEQHLVRPGDLLVGMDGDFRAAPWQGPDGLMNQRVCKITVASAEYDPHFLALVLQGYLDAIWSATSSVTVKHLSSRSIADIPLPKPTLGEQHRIVDILEDHLSRLDAGVALLDRSAVRAASLVSRVLGDVHSGAELPLGEVADIQGGIQKQPKRRPQENIASFLRVANVTPTGLDLSQVHGIELFPGDRARFGLEAGDLLVVEGNGSSSQIGRAAIWDGSIEGAVHQNHLIRVRPSSRLLPAYLEAVWNSPQSRRRLSQLSSSSSGLHTLSVSKLKSFTIPVPTLAQQVAAVGRVEVAREAAARVRRDVSVAQSRAGSLRRAMLAAAFSGQLTGAASDSDRIEELAAVM